MSDKDNRKPGDDAEVEPLTDEDLESVPGGAASREDCSCDSTGGNCTSSGTQLNPE
jgi:hypothetical protein